jgi:hypothetical protein
MAWSFAHNPFPKEQKTAVQLQREAAIVLALGGGFQAYYTQNRDGSVRVEEMEVMAGVARFARERQAWCHHAYPVPQVALLLSTSDYRRNADSLFPQHKGRSQGVLQCLLEGQHSVDLVSEGTLAPDMSRFPLVVVPEWKDISPSFRTDLLNYVRKGGSLLLIGKETSGQFAGLAGIRLAGNERLIQPLGEGKIGFLPIAVGEAYEKSGDEELRRQVDAAVRELFPNPLAEVHGSPWVDVTVSRKEGQRMIHLVNTSGNHKEAGILRSIPPVGPLQVTIRSEQKPEKITLQPQGKACDFTWADGEAHLTVDQVEIYDILVVE